MDERELFAAVLAEDFGWDDSVLVPLSGAPGAESQTFRVERDGVAVAVLHAYRRAWIDWIGTAPGVAGASRRRVRGCWHTWKAWDMPRLTS